MTPARYRRKDEAAKAALKRRKAAADKLEERRILKELGL